MLNTGLGIMSAIFSGERTSCIWSARHYNIYWREVWRIVIHKTTCNVTERGAAEGSNTSWIFEPRRVEREGRIELHDDETL